MVSFGCLGLVIVLPNVFSEFIDWESYNPALFDKCVQYVALSKAALSTAETPVTATETSGTTVPITSAEQTTQAITRQLQTTSPQATTKMETTTVQTTTVPTTTALAKCVNTFHITYDQKLVPNGWRCVANPVNFNDLPKELCEQRCLQDFSCQAYMYSTERTPRCTLYESKSKQHGGQCTRKREFDWTLFEIENDCRPRVCAEFNTTFGQMLEGCASFAQSRLFPRTRNLCKRECARRADCAAALFSSSRTPCVLYKEGPSATGNCRLRNQPFGGQKYLALYIKKCSSTA